MRVAVTGATGFIGRHILRELVHAGHSVRGWQRPDSDPSRLEDISAQLDWRIGVLGDDEDMRALVDGCEAVVHSALDHPSGRFMGGEGDLIPFLQTNLIGTLKLIQMAKEIGVRRFVFLSTCAVHDIILDDRPLDETHPTWAKSHYGAHKGAIEQFVHSFGLGEGFPICALRPTGVYGIAHPPRNSKWFGLVSAVVGGEAVVCERGGKEVHAADVARAVRVLLEAPEERIIGQAFNCYDLYVSEWDVAQMALAMSRSRANLYGGQTTPKHEISTDKLRALGMTFGGRDQLEQTVQTLVNVASGRG